MLRTVGGAIFGHREAAKFERLFSVIAVRVAAGVAALQAIGQPVVIRQVGIGLGLGQYRLGFGRLP